MVITILPLCPEQHHDSHWWLPSACKTLHHMFDFTNRQTKSYVSLSSSICCTLYMFEFTIVVNGFDLCCILICVCLWICAEWKARICASVWVACGFVPSDIILIILYLNLLYTYGLVVFVLVFSLSFLFFWLN